MFDFLIIPLNDEGAFEVEVRLSTPSKEFLAGSFIYDESNSKVWTVYLRDDFFIELNIRVGDPDVDLKASLERLRTSGFFPKFHFLLEQVEISLRNTSCHEVS